MKKILFVFALTSLSYHLALAENIKCIFTEPFVTTEYQVAQNKLSLLGSAKNSKLIEGVSRQVLSPTKFQLVNQAGIILQILSLTQNGSDGMSDRVYPYEAEDFSIQNGSSLFGGCFSN